jgi:acetylglutamate kinase
LLRELFTVKGAGTLLRKGVRIERHLDHRSLDRPRLLALLASSFGKPPAPSVLERPLRALYLEEAYRGAALVADSPLGPYLSKFAVTREAQGEGIGQDLWNALSADCPSLFWRARRDNPIRAWYERQCDGRYDSGPWTVYVRGLPHAQLPAAVDFALAQPVDFETGAV